MPDLPAEPSPPTPSPAGPAGACQSCGAAVPPGGGLCPRCRASMQGDDARLLDPDAEPFVVADRLCLACGYSLDGLRSDRECPECGTRVARSLRGNLLRYSSPSHLRTLHVGMFLAELATLSLVAVLLLIIGAYVAVEYGWWSESAADLTTEILSVVSSAAAIVGWWMFSEPDPTQVGRDSSLGARKLLRISLAFEGAMVVGAFAVTYLVPVHTAGADAGELISAVAGLVWLVRFVTSMLYMRSVALRFPDDKLYRHAGRLAWLGPLLTVLLCVVGLFVAYVSYILLQDRARVLLKAARAQAAGVA